MSVKNFALLGAGGYIAPRHLKAIRDTGNQLIAAVDPFDSVGILDRYFHNVKFFRDHPERKADYLSICTPNYLHDAHCRLALRLGANAICEKPLVVNPWNLEQLEALESESPGKIYTVLQLRVHPALLKIKKALEENKSAFQHQVMITYITARGPWYNVSWKGSEEKSGGVATNIGIHLFDMVQWLFGEFGDVKVHLKEKDRMSGFVELERARVNWFLSVNEDDLPVPIKPGDPLTYRSITIDGEEVEFSSGFTDLHTRVYEKTLQGEGFGIEDAKASIDLTYQIRQAEVSPLDDLAHPLLRE